MAYVFGAQMSSQLFRAIFDQGIVYIPNGKKKITLRDWPPCVGPSRKPARNMFWRIKKIKSPDMVCFICLFPSYIGQVYKARRIKSNWNNVRKNWRLQHCTVISKTEFCWVKMELSCETGVVSLGLKPFTAAQPIFATGWQPSICPGYATGTANPGL